MPIFLAKELETEVFGTGDGFICIVQKDEFGNETAISLSVNQFESIFNHDRTILREAYESNDTQNGDENSGQS